MFLFSRSKTAARPPVELSKEDYKMAQTNTPTQQGNRQNLPARIQTMPSTFTERMTVATTLAKSGLTGELATPERVFLALQTGAELGITPMASIRGIHVIKGKPTLSADLMIGLIMARPDFYGIKQEYSPDGNTHTTIIKRKFHYGVQEFRGQFSWQNAVDAGLIKPDSNWHKYKAQMLQHRSDTMAARKAYPDLFTGCYSPEEIDPEYEIRSVQAVIIPQSDNSHTEPQNESAQPAKQANNDQSPAPKTEKSEEWKQTYKAASEILLKYETEKLITRGDVMATIQAITGKRIPPGEMSTEELEELVTRIEKAVEFKKAENTDQQTPAEPVKEGEIMPPEAANV
jgi:hypothetical protein